MIPIGMRTAYPSTRSNGAATVDPRESIRYPNATVAVPSPRNTPLMAEPERPGIGRPAGGRGLPLPLAHRCNLAGSGGGSMGGSRGWASGVRGRDSGFGESGSSAGASATPKSPSPQVSESRPEQNAGTDAPTNDAFCISLGKRDQCRTGRPRVPSDPTSCSISEPNREPNVPSVIQSDIRLGLPLLSRSARTPRTSSPAPPPPPCSSPCRLPSTRILLSPTSASLPSLPTPLREQQRERCPTGKECNTPVGARTSGPPASERPQRLSPS